MYSRRFICWIFPLLAIAVAATTVCGPGDVAVVSLPDSYPLDLDHQAPGPDLAAWGDDLDTALARSAESGRPVLALYRDPADGPGAGGLTAQPLLAEAAENLFVPLLLAAGDGEGGARVFDAEGHDLVPPAAEVNEPGELAALMVAALEDGGGSAPRWLQLVAAENGAAERRMLTMAMYCYWEGEAKLGNMDGVLATRSGMMGEDEVVEVVYDPEALGFETLVARAREMDCATSVYAHTAGDLARARELVGGDAKPAPERAGMIDERQVKYALRRTPMAHLPLTPLQAAKINADIRLGPDPARWLSPRQLDLLDRVKACLAENPDGLDTFLPPGKLSLLADYEARLRHRLAE